MIAGRRFGGGFGLTLLIGAAAAAYLVRDHLHTPYDSLFESKGKEFGIPSNFLRGIARQESNFNPKALNPAGTKKYANGSQDVGLMQVNTITAAKLGYTHDDLLDPTKCVTCACKYLVAVQKELKGKLSAWTWAASYNTGAAKIGTQRGQDYSASVVYHWQLYEFGRVFA